MKRSKTPLVAAAVCAAAFFSGTAASGAEPTPVVVELFTSQGCSSCPPADRLLGELAGRDEVLALGFHVTYWDRLGWPDTFGLEASTRRQEAYADWLGQQRVYTPQMMIGGRIDVVGSSRRRVLEAIQLIKDHGPSGPALAVVGERLAVGAGAEVDAAIWLVAFDHRHDVAIARGENRGRTLRYHQVVRELIRLAYWRGRAIELDLPVARLSAAGRDGAVVLVQSLSDGTILAATRLPLKRG